MATVSEHITEARRLLHDPSGVYWNSTDVLADCNSAIRLRDQVTGGNRDLIEFTLTAGTSLYDFTDIGNTLVFDIVSITVLFNGIRVVLNQVSYTTLIASPAYRAWTVYRDVPRAFARYGANKVRLGPIPSLAYDTEWDICQVSETLELADDDPLPYPYTEPVPYYLAYLAKINERQYDEADWFKEEFYRLCSMIEGARTGLLPSAYSARR